MFDLKHPFEANTGSDRLGSAKFFVPLILFSLFLAHYITLNGVSIGITLIIFPFIILYAGYLFANPIVGIYTVIFLGFTILGLTRYVSVGMIGLSIDTVLFVTLIAMFFNKFHEKLDWSPVKKDIALLSLIWMLYGLFGIVNPEIRLMELWLSSFRTVSSYMLFIVILVLMLFKTKKQLYSFLFVWGALSIIASLKGIMQLYVGLDAAEQAWLDVGAHNTHVLFGKLRIFSFLSDAGQFGANQAYAGVVFLILSLKEPGFGKKLFFLTAGLLGIWGMFLSGTRGAISVPLAGFMLFFFLKKNKYILISGMVLMAVVFVFFKYTMIGQDIQQIRRMRTAFDPNDASLQTRLANQRTLSRYLSSRPFGGGLGHAGVKVQKKLPNSFLANIATDSWYVLIWAEQGIVGLYLHLFILFYIVIKSSYLIMFRIRDPLVKHQMTALTAGLLGIMVASYGNAVLGQIPTSITIYISMALILTPERFDDGMAKDKEARKQNSQLSK